MNQQLAFDKGQKLIQAVQRLRELSSETIVTKNTDAEKAGLQAFLSAECTNHADELLACWLAVRREYEPLVGVIATVLDRVGAIRRNTQEALRQQSAQPTPRADEVVDNAAPAPENLVQLVQP